MRGRKGPFAKNGRNSNNKRSEQHILNFLALLLQHFVKVQIQKVNGKHYISSIKTFNKEKNVSGNEERKKAGKLFHWIWIAWQIRNKMSCKLQTLLNSFLNFCDKSTATRKLLVFFLDSFLQINESG